MFDILLHIPRRHKKTHKGWISFNCPVCHIHGQSQDKRGRGGLILTGGFNWSYHCFNCGHKAAYVRGRTLSARARQLLIGFGLDVSMLAAINMDSLRFLEEGNLPDDNEVAIPTAMPKFESIELPAGDLLDPTNPAHKSHVEFIERRGFKAGDYPFYVKADQSRPGITIPFTHNGAIVGHTTRFYDKRKPKYLSELQTGYVFGMDFQEPDWAVALLMEGPMCALSLNGLASLHQTLNREQALMVRSLQREVVVVPDQNASGLAFIDQALEFGFSVSIPYWPSGIEDVNDAVQVLGRLGTLMTILANRESNELKIRLRKKWLENKLKK